jgi:hypothetical protein
MSTEAQVPLSPPSGDSSRNYYYSFLFGGSNQNVSLSRTIYVQYTLIAPIIVAAPSKA